MRMRGSCVPDCGYQKNLHCYRKLHFSNNNASYQIKHIES